MHVAQALHLADRQPAADHLFFHGGDFRGVRVAHRLGELLARGPDVAAVVQLCNDVAEHGDALLAARAFALLADFGPGKGLAFDGRGDIA